VNLSPNSSMTDTIAGTDKRLLAYQNKQEKKKYDLP